MLRVVEHRPGLAALDDLTATHHDGLVADAPDHGEVVADHEQRQTTFPADSRDDLEHLRLHRDVEGARGLVHHQHVGFDREGAGDRDPLALTS